MFRTRPQAITIAIAASFLALGLVLQGESPSVHAGSFSKASYHHQLKPNDLIIAQAKTYLGTPYGSGRGQMTCTEFTRATYGNSMGVWLPTVPSQQMAYGWKPRRTKRGDLLFYSESGGGITHVSIYMGHGKIIHSSSYFGKVTTSYSRYMAYAYVTTRRIR